jgi:hypothetical protein
MTTTSPAPTAATHRAEVATRVVLIGVGAMTATPALSLVSPEQLAGYGVESPDLVVTTLLQHRGVLQLALGAAIIWAAFDPRVRVPVLLAATVTKGAGVLLILTRPTVFAAAPGNIGLWFDLVCLVLLPAIAVTTIVATRRTRSRARIR